MEQQPPPLMHRLHRIVGIGPETPACRSDRCRSGRDACPTPAVCSPPWQEAEEIREPFIAVLAQVVAAFFAAACLVAFVLSFFQGAT